MNAPERVNDWTAANQQLLVAEFARLRALLGEPGEGGNAALASAPCFPLQFPLAESCQPGRFPPQPALFCNRFLP